MRRRGRDVSGWFIADKPVGMTSTRLCQIVKRAFCAKKLGHAGTLDPLAQGVLPLALGGATKTVPYAMDGSKTYRFIISFGQERDTDDREGVVTKTSDVIPTTRALAEVLPQFVGDILQTPPLYSALKIDGKRACDRARKGEDVALSPRGVRINKLELIRRIDKQHVLFEADTGKGVYIRSLARDIARATGSAGHVSFLRRTRVGKFHEKDAIALDKLSANGETNNALDSMLYPIETVLADIPALPLGEENTRRFRCGQRLSLRANGWDYPWLQDKATIRVENEFQGQKFLALGYVEDGCLRPKRILIND